MKQKIPGGILLLTAILLLIPAFLISQVLGPCGGSPPKPGPAPAAVKGAAAPQPPAGGLVVKPVPLPGQRALDFQLQAVVGDEIKQIKLSDYQGKWRVLCFFPAVFTFV